MTAPLRLGYATAIWGREWLTRTIFKSLEYLRGFLAPEIELVVAVAGSEGETSENMAKEFDFKYAEIPNEPLGAKWNAALALLADEEVSGVCIMGSDDLANAEYFWQIAKYIKAGEQLLGLSGLYFFDHPTSRLLYWQGYPPPREDEGAGAGRYIGRKILEKLEWTLWPPMLPAGLDRAMRERLRKMGFNFSHLLRCHKNDAVIVDIKGHGGMNGFEHIAASGPSMLVGDPKAFFVENFGPEIASLFFPADLR